MKRRIEPTRLTLARRKAGLSKAQLAARVGVSPGMVVLWENGERDPTARLEKLIEALAQPESILFGDEVPTTQASSVSFRRRQDATRAIRDFAACSVDMAAGILTPTIRGVLERLPPVDVPNLTGMAPEPAAQALRSHWNLTDKPLRNVVQQMEARGVRLFWIERSNPSLSAFCTWIDGEPYVVLNSAKRDGCRSRFDAAHELAHLCIHRDVDFEDTNLRDREREADAFASAFLMPRSTFVRCAPTIFDMNHLLGLKSTWRVSVQAMVRRMRDLGLMSEWQYESAFIQMSGMGWRSNAEPGAGPMETSAIHWAFCDRLAMSDVSPRQYIEKSGIRWDDAKEMMPVLELYQMNLQIPARDDEVPQGIEQGHPISLPFDE